MSNFNHALVDLQEKLKLLNLQLSTRTHGSDSLKTIRYRLSQLQARVSQCQLAFTQELGRLTEAKNLCQSILADLQPSLSPGIGGKESFTSHKRDKSTSTPASASSSQLPTIIPINEMEFETIPKYMRGRLTQDRINGGVELINRAAREKYAFLAQNPARLAPELRQKYYDLRDMEVEETAGKYFVTETDMKSTLGTMTKGNASTTGVIFKFDSTGRAILAIMRHLGRIKEVRGGGAVRYVLLSSHQVTGDH